MSKKSSTFAPLFVGARVYMYTYAGEGENHDNMKHKDMMNQFLSRINRLMVALIGVMVLSISSVYAGTAYSDGRAYLRQGSPTGAGKVYVSTSSSTPAASSYKACNTVQTSETTTPSASAQVSGEKKTTTYYFWATANAGYIFTGWYDSNGNLLNSGAANISKSITSGQAGGSDTHAYLDLHASFIKQIQMSFVVPTNGSFTINHNGSAVANYASFATEGKVVLTATPDDGYKLRGWYTTTNGGVTKKYVAFGTTYEPNFTSNVTIGADFVPDDGKANFWNKNNGKIYDNLNTANSEASSGQVIVAVNDGVLGAGTYTIKAGVTLLIPFDETYNLMTTPKVNHMASGTSSLFLFRKLTLAPGAVINCSGNICVGGQMASVNGGKASSYPMGACGMLDLSRGGTINLKSGAVLYAWGFVKGQDMDQGNNTEASGVGKIVAESGATVWEDFQVGEWRGGTASSTIYNNKGSWKFFPFQSYTIQNVEAPVEYQTGSKLKCYWAIFGNGQTFTVPFTAVGASADKPLFVLGSGGTMKKWYDPTTDRVCYELGGGASIDAIQLSVMGESVSSSDYYLPIPANMHIALRSGCTLNLTKAMTMHAGSVVEVKSGATLNINARVHMFDQEDWGTYCMYAYYYRTYRNLTSHYNRGEGTSKATLEDATLIVDGTVNVGAQMLYATAHGANICGNGGGTFVYGTLPGNTTMTQCTNLSDANSVNIRSANLHNDNASYTKGIAATTFKNINGRWFSEAASTIKSNKTYDFTYIKSGDVYGTGGTNATVAACYSKDKTGLVLQDKWANVKKGCSSKWFDGIDDGHLYNYSLNKAWHQYIKTGSFTTGTGEDAETTNIYAGSDGKLLYETDCDFEEIGEGIDENCLYPVDDVQKALVDGAFVAVTANASPDHGYHATADASAYYLCFDGCVWHPATRNAENRYTVSGTTYIWYGDKWLAVQYDSSVSLYYSLSATNVKIYYEYVNHEWVLATPVAEVTTSAGTEQVFSLGTAVSKAASGGTNVTIRLLKNISISTKITYATGNNCSLDLNGFTLSSSVADMITINHATANFIIKDQSAAGTGKIELTFSVNNDRRRAIYVQNGHVIVNGGTIKSVNTLAYNSTNTKTYASGITVAAGKRLTVNGGVIIGESQYNPYGIEIASGAGADVHINGGTITAHSTLDDSPYGIIASGGTLYVSGGTINAIADADNSVATSSCGIYVNNAGHLEMTGGEVISNAHTSAYGIRLARSLKYDTNEPRSETGVTSLGLANISGGTITAQTLHGAKAFGIYSLGTANVSGNTTINAYPYSGASRSTTAHGIYVSGGKTTVSGNVTINATASKTAYGIVSGIEQPSVGGVVYNGKVEVNGGTINVTTTSGENAYGVYVGKNKRAVTTTHASNSSYYAGNYVNAGIDTINGGEFIVKSATTGGYGIYVEAVYTESGASGYPSATATPKCAVFGGKFKVTSTNSSAVYATNNAAIAANFSLSAGYYSTDNYLNTYKAAGKTVKDLDATVEAALITAGYTKKIAGQEYTVTWKNRGGAVIKTEKVESGKTPVYTGATPTYSDAWGTYEFIGWAATDGGAVISPLPAIAASNVEYYARYRGIYADVTANGTTTRYYDVNTAWTAAKAYKQAYIKVLCSAANLDQLVFNPTPADAIITLDLNGYHWGMGSNADPAKNKAIFLEVNKAGCKLIITDSRGGGYINNTWSSTGAVLTCAKVTAGELILQGGEIRANNTGANGDNKQYSLGVQVNGGTQFTMTGGKVYATDGYSPHGINVSPSGNADIVGGTVHADATGGNAYGVLAYGTVAVGGDALVKATTAGSGAYPGYVDRGTLTVADSCSIVATAPSQARGFYVFNGGKITVNDKPTITATVTSGNEAYGGYVSGSGSEIEINGGTYNITGAAASGSVMGVRAISSGVATINNGTFTLQGGNNWTFGVFAQTGTVNINGGDFTVSQASGGNKEGIRVYPDGTCNITGGTFTVTTIGSSGGNALHAYGGTTNISGNPVFNAYYGITVADGNVASEATTATVVVDGGTYNTQSFGVKSRTTSPTTGDVTIWDGKFNATWSAIDSGSEEANLKIRGGYYTNNGGGKLSVYNESTNPTGNVISPSTVEALTSGPEYDAGYRYHVISKYNVTWSINGVNTVQEYSRNETPSYGSTPTIDDGNTWEFLGWSPEIVPVTADVTYTAQFQKWEAEVYEGENPTPKRFEHFTDAWNAAKNLPVAKVKLLSNVSMSTQLVLTPDSAAGSKPLTLDLNNHTLAYTGTTDRFVIVNKAGCVLKVADSSVANGGVLKYEGSYNGGIYTVVSYSGDIVLESGKIFAKNTYAGKSSRAVTPCATTTFTMTGGTAEAHAPTDARAIAQDGTPSVIVSGGKVIAKSYTISGDTVWGSTSYGICMGHGSLSVSGNPIITSDASASALGVYMYNSDASFNIDGGTFITKAHNGSNSFCIYTNTNSVGNIIHSGTFKAIGLNGGQIHAVHTVNSSVVDIKGGTFTSHANAGQSHCLFVQSGGALNVSGGSFTAESDAPSNGNIEAVRMWTGGVVNISGGTFTSTGASNNIALRNLGGTATISGGTFTSGNYTIGVAEAGSIGSVGDVTVNINGGTFISTTNRNIYASTNAGTTSVAVTVNGGYFHSAGTYVVEKAGTATIVLNGGKYNETSGSNHKTNITSYKGSTTTVSDISETVAGKTYVYELLTKFNISWRGGSSYTKDEQIYSGIVPTNNELVGKHFLRNDSAFYFTGWSPTPTAVTGDATYNALGVYHEASVKVGSAEPIIYDDFDEAWSYAMEQASATITLLSNITRTTSIVYSPENDNARHTFDLNNFTIKENTKDRLLVVNKSDAKLTITDNSSAKGGCLYKKMNSSANMYTTVIYHGELILAGGKLYVENTKDDKEWHPAIAVHTSVSTDGIFTMTGGTVESQAKYLAYPIYNYATTNISGGTIIANATTQGNALGFYAVAGTATISGGTFNITASTNAIGAIATGWISADGSNSQQGTLNITGGTFNVSCTTSGAHAVQATGTGKKIGGTYYTSHGIMNVSGGTFNVTCPPIAAATQVFAAQVNAWRQFDNALPHTMVAEARGEMNISGGTFTVDARNNGAWVANSGNVDLLRNWGILNVSGGNFTIYQYSTPSAISVFRGKATVTGNPVFNVYAHTGNAYAVCAGYWTHENYCDKNAANNLAEAEINGGTFKIITEGQNTNVIYSLGQISAESRDAVADTITAHAGYAMNAKITVNGGEFLGICPNESGKYPIMLNSRTDIVGTYGTAKSEIYVNGGKFKSRKGTEADNTTTGAVNCHNNVGTLLLTGGYYETNGQLSAQKADTCDIINITSAAIDPEYNNGYRYRIDVHYVAQVTATGVDRKFATFRGAFDYAKTIANSKITLLDNINYTGLNFVYNPTTATTCTLDLNGFTFKGAISGHTGDGAYNNDRLLVINKAGATFTIKDSSVGKTGKWSHEKAGATFPVIVYHGKFVLQSGTIHGKNTSGGSVQAIRSENYADALISVTGGKAHAETAGAAYGMSTYNQATISGGEILAESSGGEAYGVYTNEAIDTTIISGGRIKASGTNAYGVLSKSVFTISGGKILSESTTADGTAFGVRVEQNTTTINGADSIYAHAPRYAYSIYSYGSTAIATVNGGKIIAHNVNSANNGASIAAYALSRGTININNGTFYAQCDRAGSSNVQTTRTANLSTINIAGGTFHAEGFQAVNARGGTTTVSGGTFYATTGLCAMDWADAATITANVSVTGGTFDCTGVCLYVRSNNSNNASPSRNGHSDVLVTGGKFKTTGSTIAQLTQVDGTDPSTLTIAGGYFNEKSGTTHKDQIATFIADTCEINTLDPLYESIYKYQVAPHYVAKVKTGSTTTYYTTAKRALDYAKTVSNPTITLLDNCTLAPEGDATNYNRLNSNSWTGTLDLNNFTLTPTISSEGRAFTVTGTGSKFTITDNSVAKGGKIYYQGPSTGNIIYIVVEGSAEVELAAGTIYVEDTSADKVAVGFVVNSATAKFTQSGGTFTVKGKYQAQGYYGSGTATFSGGSMYVEGETSQAIGLHPNAATAVLNVSGTFELDAKSTNNAYAVYAENGTATIEGTPDFYAESPTRARVLQGTSSGNLTVDGGTFEANGTTASQSDCYVLIPEGSSTMTINGGKFKNNQNNFTYKASGATLTINGGYFNETSGTNHKTKIDPYKGSGKVVLDLDTDDAEYAAGYRYVVTADPVAKVKAGSEVTYYTTLPAAFNYAKTQNNAEVTLLKDVVSTSTYTWSPSSAISNTFDLNGHSLSSTAGTVLGVGKAGATLTIKDTPGGGSISYSSTTGNWSPTVHVGNGKLILQGGTISRTANSDNAIGVQVYTTADATPEFEMTGGKIQTSGGSSSYAVLTKSTGSNYAETTISGGEVSATATGTYAFALTAAQKGRITVKGTNNPRISASDATNATQVARNEGGGATFTIEGGLFKASHNSSPFNGAVSISGGYFNEYGSTTTYKTQIDTRCVSPKHPIELTAAEQAALGEGGTDYKYKVVDAYTLTWTTDGDALTGTYTNGMTAVGATITAPNTPTKTGYTFAGWSPAVAATMPAANTTYTATWTANTNTAYTVNHYQQNLAGDGYDLVDTDNLTGTTGASVTPAVKSYTGFTAPSTQTVTILADGSRVVTYNYTRNSYTLTWDANGGSITGEYTSGSVKYGAAITAPANANVTRENYEFAGWNTTPAATMPAANTTYTAQWTAAVASVKIGSGTPTYHATLADAFTKAKTGDNALITLLQDVSGVSTGLTYNPSSAYKCTLNLNDKKITGTTYTLLNINKAGATFTITDSGSKGEIATAFSNGGSALRYCAYVSAGILKLEKGKISINNTTAYNSKIGCAAVGVATNANYKFIMEGGALEASGNYRAHGVYSYGTTEISGGTINATVSASYGTAYGVYSAANTTTVSGTPIITVEAYKNAYGGMAAGNTPSSSNGSFTNGTLNIEGGTFNVTTTTQDGAYGAYATAAPRVISSGTYAGTYFSYGTVNVSGGTFNVTAHRRSAYGVYVSRAYVQTQTRPNAVSSSCPAQAEITGGTFIVKTDETAGQYTAEGVRSLGTTTISGGSFTITANTYSAMGVYALDGTTTIENTHNPEFTVRANAYGAYGVYAGSSPASKTGIPYNGIATVNGGTFDVALNNKASADNKTVYGVCAASGRRAIKETDSGYDASTYYVGTYASAGQITVNDGTFIVDGNNAIYGIVVSGVSSYNATSLDYNGGTISCPAVSAPAKATINGGKFKMTGSSDVYAINTSATAANFKIQGGYYNINTNLSSRVVSPKKVLTLRESHAFYPDGYRYTVNQGGTVTWKNYDNSTLQTKDFISGETPSYTGATPTKPADASYTYTHNGWTPAITTMANSNATYTATFSQTENKYTVTVAAEANGTASPASVSGVGCTTASGDITATPNTGYHFDNWTLPAGVTAAAGYSATSNPIRINATAAGTITANFAPNTNTAYTVKHYQQNLDGSYPSTPTEIDNLTGTTGASVTPAVKSYTGFTAPSTQTVTILADGSRVVTYNYTRNSYTLTWALDGGSISVAGTTAGSVKYGASLTAPTVTKTGYTFSAWSPSVPATMPASNSTYTATWSEKSYTVTFYNGGHGTVKVNSSTVANGATASVNHFTTKTLAATASTGYTFAGWTKTGSVTLGNAANASTTITATATGGTVTATWTANTYNITYKDQGNVAFTGVHGDGYPTTHTYGTATALVSPTKTGYTFGGWYTTSACTGDAITSVGATAYSADFTLYAKWTINSYTITFNSNGGSAVASITQNYGTAVVAPANPTKTGYTFAGWDPAVPSTMPASNTTCVAQWTADTYTVTLDRNSGTTGATSVTMTYNSSTMTGYSAPTRTGYTFNGYYTSESSNNGTGTLVIDTEGSLQANVDGYTGAGGVWIKTTATTLYAKWTQNRYAITFYNGGHGTVAYNGTVVANGKTAKVYQVSVKKLVAKADLGYDFAGWTKGGTNAAQVTISNASADSTGIKASATNASVTANWTAHSYSISYDLAGGSVATPNPTSYTIESSAITLNNPTKTGYTFAGWTGTGLDAATTTVTIAAGSTGDRSYTATWELADVGAWLDIVDVDNANSRLIVNVTSWPVNGWPYSINGVPYAKDAREDDRTLKVTYSGAPGENFVIAVQKNGGAWLSNHTYVIPQEITSNTAISADQTKNLYVKNGATLTVNANISVHNIYVAPDAKLTINSGKTLTADSIFLRTTAEGAAEMVKNGSIAGTTKLVYTRIIKDKDFHLFGLPLPCPAESVHLSDGVKPPYTTGWVLRSYDESRRAESGADGNNWVTLPSDGTIAGGAGYEMFSASNYYREFYFPVDLGDLTNKVHVDYDLGAAGEKQAGWNAITSPFTHTYENAVVPEGLVVNWYEDGFYSQEVPSAIPPATVFAFQTTKTGDLSFDGSSIVTKMPRRAVEEEVQIQWINLDLEDANGLGDQTSIYSHPDRYEQSYQTGIDIAKQSFEAPRAILYSSHVYGDMAFAGVADSLLEQGVALTVYSPAAQELTFSMRDNEWTDRMAFVWLIDHQTGTRTDLLWSDYTFDATEGTTRGRFTIQGVFRAPQVATDIDNTDAAGREQRQVRKLIIHDKMYIEVNGQLFDATGKMVNK